VLVLLCVPSFLSVVPDRYIYCLLERLLSETVMFNHDEKFLSGPDSKYD